MAKSATKLTPRHNTTVQRGIGHAAGRQLTPKKPMGRVRSATKTLKPKSQVLRVTQKAVGTQHMKWWLTLPSKDQLAYIKQHPKTTLKPTRRARPRKAANQNLAPSRPGQHNNKHASIQPRRPKVKPTGPAKTQHWRHLHKIFGHMQGILHNPQQTNKLVNAVSQQLGAGDNKLLDSAKDYAQKHPDLIKPPHKFRKVLLRTMTYGLLAAGGAAIAGPAGVFLVTSLLNDWKNHGGGLDKFAWNALRGKDFEGNDTEELDKNERPAMLLIKSLKIQLENSKNKADSERIRNIIEQLTDQVQKYQETKHEK